MQRTQIQLPTPTLGGSQLLVTPATRYWKSSFDLREHPFTHTDTYININKNNKNKYLKRYIRYMHKIFQRINKNKVKKKKTIRTSSFCETKYYLSDVFLRFLHRMLQISENTRSARPWHVKVSNPSHSGSTLPYNFQSPPDDSEQHKRCTDLVKKLLA